MKQLFLTILISLSILIINADNDVRGLYVSAWTVQSKRFPEILKKAESAKINTIIFDLKNMNGHVFFKNKTFAKYGKEKNKPILNINEVIKQIHSHNMKAVVRLVMFHDQHLAKKEPIFCAKKSDGTAWHESSTPAWLDSSNKEVQELLLSLIREVSKTNIDEIQLDYVRFPTGGNVKSAIREYETVDDSLITINSQYQKREKFEIIAEFVSKAKKICEKKNVLLSADTFAIVSWQSPNDIANTGQKLSEMTKSLNFLHPMIYPSHFANDFNYRKNVRLEPYDILYKGTKLSIKFSNINCKIVPYIQAFDWLSNYSKEYLFSQIVAIEDAGGEGFILWNAFNNYETTLDWIIELNEKRK